MDVIKIKLRARLTYDDGPKRIGSDSAQGCGQCGQHEYANPNLLLVEMISSLMRNALWRGTSEYFSTLR